MASTPTLEAVNERRISLGISQAELGRKAGYAERYAQFILNGDAKSKTALARFMETMDRMEAGVEA